MTIEISKSSADNLYRISQLVEALYINARIVKELKDAVEKNEDDLHEFSDFNNACIRIDTLFNVSSLARKSLDNLNKTFLDHEITLKE